MEYKVDFNPIRELQSVSVEKNNFLNLIRASILPIKFLSRLFYIQISCIQPDKVTNLINQCWGSFFIYCGFIDRLGPYHFISKELLQFFYLLYKFICFCNLQGLINKIRGVTQGFKTHLKILAIVSQEQGDFYNFQNRVICSKLSEYKLVNPVIL